MVLCTWLGGGVLALVAFRRGGHEQDVVRTRGIVIVDEAGRERILIGAPVPAAANRVRTDIRRVEQLWGARFPRQYLTEWYPTYRNSLHGMVVLDERGIDRLAIGDSVPDPNIGKRWGAEAGMVINDSEGFERSGFGLLRRDSTYRVSLGLDAAGGERWDCSWTTRRGTGGCSSPEIPRGSSPATRPPVSRGPGYPRASRVCTS
jgi:hypothetical protein